MPDARKAAEERYPIRLPYNLDFEIRSREQDSFVAGAEWQAARAPQITDEMVDIIQEAVYDDWREGDCPVIRAALEAALGRDTKEGAA